jgi:hypothetical protein
LFGDQNCAQFFVFADGITVVLCSTYLYWQYLAKIESDCLLQLFESQRMKAYQSSFSYGKSISSTVTRLPSTAGGSDRIESICLLSRRLCFVLLAVEIETLVQLLFEFPEEQQMLASFVKIQNICSIFSLDFLVLFS